MRRELLALSMVVGTLALFMGCIAGLPVDTTTPRMTKEELRPLLGSASVFVVDIRLEDEWKAARWKIKGAVREDPEKEIDGWIGKYPKDKTLVFYCS